MKERLKILVTYILFWLLFFEVSRVIFLAYNYALTKDLSFTTVLMTFVSGFRHDVSLLGYVVELSSIILIVSLFVKKREIFKSIFKIQTIVFLIPFSLLTIADAELYRNWGYRTDSSVLQYLALPKESLSSIPLWHLLLLLLAVAVLIVAFCFLYKKLLSKMFDKIETANKFYAFVFLIVMGLCIIPIRGGIGVAALRTGAVYFSSQPFANHAAINDHWHFLYSFGYNKKEKSFVFMDESNCDSICSAMLRSKKQKPVQLLRTKRPNVLLFVLESFTAQQIGVLGGRIGVTPNLDSIAKSGILFSNCYSSATKSEMGIVSVLSGYPAQPTTAIIKYNEKSEKLPYLSRDFDSLGYNLSFFHGGDIRFGNMNSYFCNGRFEKLVTINDFNTNERTSKWGAYDHVVFNSLFNYLHDNQQPFFSVCYTLSSHEPYDVPMKSEFDGTDEYSKFLNSVHYSDSCIGDFMRKASRESWWNNTVVIFVSDHGARISEKPMPVSAVEKFHIPLIWTGGAIEKDTIIDVLFSQNDFAMMLCNQLDLPSEQYCFSKDILRGDNSFAYYAFNNGFGYIRDNQTVTWDNNSSKIINQSESLQDTTLQQGQAFLQKLTTDFCRK